MYKANFDPEELKAYLEKGLGFAIRPLRRLNGGGAVNFRAERVSDGLSFLVKCFPPDRKPNYDRLVSNLKTMEGLHAPTRLFETTCPAVFADYHLLCLEWKTGEVVHPSVLTEGEWSAFLNDYRDFWERMQHSKITRVWNISLEEWRSAAFRLCRGFSGRTLRRALLPLAGQDLQVRTEDLRVIHGDFHLGNVLFRNGRVECFMDLENLFPNYGPADIVVYCYSAARAAKGDVKCVLARFAQAVRELPFSAYEWQMAIFFCMLGTLYNYTKGFRRLEIFSAVKSVSRIRFYELLHQQVIEAVR